MTIFLITVSKAACGVKAYSLIRAFKFLKAARPHSRPQVWVSVWSESVQARSKHSLCNCTGSGKAWSSFRKFSSPDPGVLGGMGLREDHLH